MKASSYAMRFAVGATKVQNVHLTAIVVDLCSAFLAKNVRLNKLLTRRAERSSVQDTRRKKKIVIFWSVEIHNVGMVQGLMNINRHGRRNRKAKQRQRQRINKPNHNSAFFCTALIYSFWCCLQRQNRNLVFQVSSSPFK